MEPWNDPALLPPPVSTVLCSDKNVALDLVHVCNNIIKVLLKQSPFHKESAILSRFLYKFDKKFRNDIGYRIFKKINTALRRYLTLHILKDVQNFVVVVPTEDDEKYLPSKQMLEYVMIRIITFSKIMMRVCVCTKKASIFYLNRVKRGESHWMSLMPYALLTRIWTMSTVLLQHSCSWYTSLNPFLKKLQPKGLDFLPDGYALPSDLGAWLDIKNLDCHGRFEWSHKKSIQINVDFAEDDEITFDSILDYVKDINSEDNEVLKGNSASSNSMRNGNSQQLPPSQAGTDQGVAISREYFQSFFNKQEVKETHSADIVINKITLDTFISKEEKYRNEINELSLTKHLSFMQWQSLRASLIGLSDMLSKNRKIEKKFKKIWREKCVDYM